MVWTGKELIVVGGEAPAARGESKTVGGAAAYSPQTGRWRSLASPPFDPPARFLAAIWTGRELVVVGMPCTRTVPTADDHGIACKPARRRAAVYDPRRDQWKQIPMPAVAPANTEPITTPVGWTGSQAVFRMADRDQSLWAYAPAAKRWSHLADPPMGIENTLLCATRGSVAAAVGGSSAAVYDVKTRRWSAPVDVEPVELGAPGPVVDLRTGGTFCAGSHVVSVSGARGVQLSARFDIIGRSWRPMSSPPRSPGANPEAVWTGSEFVVVNSDVFWGPNRTFPRSRVYMYDPVKDSWRDLETPGDWRERGLLWVGDRVLTGLFTQQFRTFAIERMKAVPPRPEQRDATAVAYWRYWRLLHDGDENARPDASNAVYAAMEAGGTDAVVLVVALAESAPSDDDARTLAVGPLATLVARHWNELASDIRTAARGSPRFRMALCSARGTITRGTVDALVAPQPCI